MINITSKLGSIALSISGEAKPDKTDSILAAGMASLVYRGGASKLFGKGGHKRDESYSDKLAADAEQVLAAALGELFNDVRVSASAYVAPEPKVNGEAARTKMAASLQGLGLDEAAIAAAVDKAFPLKAKVEAKVEDDGDSVG